MPRPRSTITTEDVPMVHRWIRSRFRDNQWPRDWPQLTAWERCPLDKPTAKTLQGWCDRLLDAPQWKQLHAVMRAARREKHAGRTVRLSQPAYDLLHTLAQREQLTRSATIERYLGEAMQADTVQPVPVTRGTAQAETRAKMMKVRLYLRVENTSKFVRGKTKAREDIERYVFAYYPMEKPSKDREEYLLSLPYDTDEELDKTMDDILGEASSTADDRHCCIESDVIAVDDPDRSW